MVVMLVVMVVVVSGNDDGTGNIENLVKVEGL